MARRTGNLRRDMEAHRPRGRIWAVLGPTNTGKTHLAIDRMVGHGSGMIGFPLRLLARENYDRIVSLHGRGSVALITGEEKIVPPRPRWFVCTAESMPLDREVDFLAVDEVQLAADRVRGHIFTDRILHARGREETLFLGSDTMGGLLRTLVPGIEIETRPRFSTLSYVGPKKLSRLPRRTALVAFSVNDVYALAEHVRRQRGGTAVVLGALSPRTRNAQVAMYQEGEVDYMVATDAIGMGLNMDIDHVAFNALRKFDGMRSRPLGPAEIGQIAGRAGRFMRDGTFGTTNELGPLDDETVMAVENHRFERVQSASWRNRDLDFRSPRALLDSLSARAPVPQLSRTQDADDVLTLQALMRDERVAARVAGPASVRQLWEVCQVPDFRKVLADIHARLLGQLFCMLRDNDGRLSEDWVARQIDHLDNVQGDIDTLTQRIAHVRTWTYVSHRGDWLDDAAHWQDRTRRIEDRLSDALHDRLTQRFVDRRAPLFAKRARDGDAIMAYVDRAGEVFVEGDAVGAIHGLGFEALPTARPEEDRMLLTAARPAVVLEMARRARQLEGDSDDCFALEADGALSWRSDAVARLEPGRDMLTPRLSLLRNAYLEGADRTRAELRLERWLRGYLARTLGTLSEAPDAALPPAARGLLFQLREGLGTLSAARAADQLRLLGRADRKVLSKYGIRFGVFSVYVAGQLNREARQARLVLWAAHAGLPVPPLPGDEGASRPAAALPPAAWEAIGYRVLDKRAMRVDRVERLAAALRASARQGPFLPAEDHLRLAGCDAPTLVKMARDLGFRSEETPEGTMLRAKRRPGHRGGRPRGPAPTPNLDSPFARLRGLVPAK